MASLRLSLADGHNPFTLALFKQREAAPVHCRGSTFLHGEGFVQAKDPSSSSLSRRVLHTWQAQFFFGGQ
eukprot:1933108-Rhodomonas_salina.1